MLFSGFTGLAQLGLFSIAGLLAAAAAARWVLPSLLPAGFSVSAMHSVSRQLTVLVNQAPRARLVLLVLVAVASTVLFLRRDELWNDNLSSMSPVAPELLQLDQQLRDDMGVSDVNYMLVLQAADQESLLQSGEAVASVLQAQVEDAQLAGFDAPVLPSRKRQLSRQAALPDSAVLQNNLAGALRELPLRSEIFAPFFQEIAQAKKQPVLDLVDLKGSNLGMKLDAQLMQTKIGWQLILPLRGVKNADALAHNLKRKTDQSFILLDMKRESEMLLHDYRKQAINYSLIGVLIIFTLLLVSLKSARRVFRVSQPLIASVIVVTATLLLTGHPLSIFHLVGLLLVVAVGSNYALFFDHGGETLERRERTLTSVLFANLSTVIAFGLLAFSQSPVLNAIGFTVAAGSFFSLIFSAICIEDSRVYKGVR
jgi:predicted exporter